jgi:hypothetical protein
MKFTPVLRVQKRRTLHLVTSLLALALLANTSANAQSVTHEADEAHNAASIEGSWIFAIDVFLAQQPIASFNSLISFGAGGIVVTTPSAPPLAIFYGSWNRSKSESFNTVFYQFAPDSTGSGVVLAKLSLRLHLTGMNSLAGSGKRSTCDLTAEKCVDDPIVFQFTGKRIVP